MLPAELYVFTTLVIAAMLVMLMVTSAYKRRLDFKLRKAEIDARVLTPAAPVPQDDRTDLLEDRVRVLERIATDRGQDIAHQIEALRGTKEII